MEELPLVLLGLRSAWREDGDVSPAQIVYGTSLRIPGQFVPGVESTEPGDTFTRGLVQKMRQLRPITAPHHSTGRSRHSFVPAALGTSTHSTSGMTLHAGPCRVQCLR